MLEVATLAGVSVKTVSNVVNHYVHVSAATRMRVQSALDELGYRPNLSARSLRGGRSGLIALALPELDFPYFAELARHIVHAAEAHGWTVLIDQTDGRAEREKLVMDGIRDQLIDGVIFSPLVTGARELAARRDTTPMVLLGERVHHGTMDHVGIDNVAAARAAVAHLAGLGHTRIAAIGEQRHRRGETARLRLQGYRAGLESAGLPFDPALVMPAASYHRADGAAAMTELLALADPPDAVFCFNDMLAIGALRTLRDRGARVPDDVAVVGFDDIEESSYSAPGLTTIRPDKARIAGTSIALLAARLDGGGGPSRDVTERFDLVVRRSTANPPS